MYGDRPGLVAKDSRRIRLGIIQQGIKPNALYNTMSRNTEPEHNLMLLIRFISTMKVCCVYFVIK